MRFIRKNGRVIPIREKYDTEKKVALAAGATTATVGAGVSAKHYAPVAASKLESKSIKFGKQAGRFLGKVGPRSSAATKFEKAAKVFSGSKAPDAMVRYGKFTLRAMHNSERAIKAQKLGFKAGKISSILSGAAKIFRKI